MQNQKSPKEVLENFKKSGMMPYEFLKVTKELTMSERLALVAALTTTMDQRFYDEQSGIERNLLGVHERSNLAKVVCRLSGDILRDCNSEVHDQQEPWTVGGKPIKLYPEDLLNHD